MVDVVRLRFSLLAFLPLPVALPCLFSRFADPAIALPLGFAFGLAVLLIAAGIVLGLSAADREIEQAPLQQPSAVASALLPGLVLRLDPHGQVLSADGRDRDTLLAHMLKPHGRPFAEQLHVADRIGFLQALDALRLGDDDAILELRLQRATREREEGAILMVRLDLVAERDSSGRLIGVVAQMKDASRMLVERLQLKTLRQAVETAEETKSRFLAAVSHELRTPLNAILGFSEILGGEYFGKLQNERQREYVQLIHQSGAHLLQVVNAMLDVSKIEAGHFELQKESFPVAATIRDCESMLALQARDKNVVLQSRLAADLGSVVADERALRQILINLVGNAIKFTDAGGAVMIDASVQSGMLNLAVSDTGIGISDEKLPMIGRPFAQVHSDYARRYDGTGLGLSLVKGLVALHGGVFQIASRLGEGTVVTVRLPLDGVAVSGGAAADTPAVEFPPRLKRRDEADLPIDQAAWEDKKTSATARG